MGVCFGELTHRSPVAWVHVNHFLAEDLLNNSKASSEGFKYGFRVADQMHNRFVAGFDACSSPQSQAAKMKRRPRLVEEAPRARHVDELVERTLQQNSTGSVSGALHQPRREHGSFRIDDFDTGDQYVHALANSSGIAKIPHSRVRLLPTRISAPPAAGCGDHRKLGMNLPSRPCIAQSEVATDARVLNLSYLIWASVKCAEVSCPDLFRTLDLRGKGSVAG